MSPATGFVYLDTSAALAHLLSESVRPPDGMWDEAVVASRLLEHEMRTRIRAMGLGPGHHALVDALLQQVALLELVPPVVDRLPEGAPSSLRTLDALHLATMLFLREQGAEPRLASYDRRLNAAAEALGFRLYPL